MKTSRFSDTHIIAILKQAEAGSPVPELCREHGISTTTSTSGVPNSAGWMPPSWLASRGWRRKTAGIKKMYAEARLKAEIITESMAKKGGRHLPAGRWRLRPWLATPYPSAWLAGYSRSAKAVIATSPCWPMQTRRLLTGCYESRPVSATEASGSASST